MPPRRGAPAAQTLLRFVNEKAALVPNGADAGARAAVARLLPRVAVPPRLLPTAPEVNVELLYMDETLRITSTSPAADGDGVSNLRVWERVM